MQRESRFYPVAFFVAREGGQGKADEVEEPEAKSTGEPQLLTIPEVMRLSRIGRSFIYEEIGAGRLRIVKFGRAVRVRADDYAAWVDGCTRKGAA
ncbi:MAG: helix-turn-helix transcriptional regulator [Thermomicrobiales bacterium]